MGTLVIIIHPLLTRPCQINGARDSNMREFLEKKSHNRKFWRRGRGLAFKELEMDMILLKLGFTLWLKMEKG